MKRATTIAFLAAMLAPAAVLAQGAAAVPLEQLHAAIGMLGSDSGQRMKIILDHGGH